MLSILYIVAYVLRRKPEDSSRSTGDIVQNHFIGNCCWRLGNFLRAIIMSVEDKFRAAVKVIQSLPSDGPYQPSNSTKLKFYGLYKQGTEGKCSVGRPAFWDVIGRAKWDAWNRLGDMEKDRAMNEYIEELKKIVETMSFDGNVQDFLDSIGPFYDFINLSSPELDEVKEKIERLTSSGSSCTSSLSGSLSENNSLPSSPDSTAQSTPAKEVEADKPQTNHVISNGHIPNEKQQILDLAAQTVLPSTPVHKLYSNGHAKRYAREDLEKEDEVLSIPIKPGRILTRSNSNSSESDKYYSGDSDVEVDTSVTILEAPTSSSARQGRRYRSGDGGADAAIRLVKSQIQLMERQATSLESVMALQGTVDRLNRDMDHVLARLRMLEAAYASSPGGLQAGSSGSSSSVARRRGLLGPFKELSKTTWTIIFAWPVAVHLMFKFVSWWVDRRRRLRSKPLALLS